MAVGFVWIACAVTNYVLLKKMKCDVVLRGEGGHFWFFFAPFWIIPLIFQYRDWGQENSLDDRLKEIREAKQRRQDPCRKG
ncbi:hypothetical protein HY464_00285 [Candidatus Peregrinibacteria bacterium]|nr:hypothetical protein [Candidatus Peregrinibacteria bacterium]MBI4129110.1 hypothetical protein [Candidatus Peregrinibacteria bacterium]